MRRSTLGLASALLLVLTATSTPAALAMPGRALATTRHPAVIGYQVIGHSVQGRPIRAWQLGRRGAGERVVFMGAIHGNETGPSRILFDLRNGPAVHGADIWVIPYANPDGVAHNVRTNAHGVDINRNFPVGWMAGSSGENTGAYPASEPETRALMSFFKKVRPRYVVSFHQPLDGVGASTKGGAFVQRLHRDLRLPVRAFNCNNTCHGTMTMWFNKRLPGAAITVEYGARVSRQQARVTGPDGLLRAVGAWR